MIARRPVVKLREESGFTMIVAVVVILVTTLLVAASLDAVLDNAQATRNDLDQKRALLAAYAGLSVYQSQLNDNPEYWESCLGANGSTGSTGTTSVPQSTDSGSTESYSWQVLVASTTTSYTSCSTSNPIASVIQASSASNNQAAGSFRVEFHGFSGKIERTVVAQFRPPTFLNFIYFSNFEIEDPQATGDSESACAVYYQAGRNNNNCGGPISFITGDNIQGPLHSNDEMAICGSPTFGRTSADAVETPGQYSSGNGCPDTPNNIGSLNTNAGTLAMPANDSELLQTADGGSSTLTNGCSSTAGCVFTGPTTIVLNGSGTTSNGPTCTNASSNTFTATNSTFPTGQTFYFPCDGVIYVQNTTAGCGVSYTPYLNSSDYAAEQSSGCGDATVAGNYSQSLTIGADYDIVINGNIYPSGMSASQLAADTPPTGTALLGLVANDFVRVYHPLSDTRQTTGQQNCETSGYGGNSNATGSLYSPYIYAAILSVQHSFVVDNFDCGGESPALGNLTVYGAIAQNFRGPVGTGYDGSVYSGYIKKYFYDQRLETLSPPSFLSPASTGWTLARVTECGDTAGAC